MRESIDKVGFNRKIGSLGLMAGAVFMLAGCVGGEDTSMANPAVKVVNTPAQIAQVSNADYNLNENGLITASTLASWMDDATGGWLANRPEGINGRLIIIQTSDGVAGDEYIDTTNVDYAETYRIQVNNRMTATRSNNVVTSGGNFIPDGETMDAFLRDFNIDPRNDMIVCAGSGTADSSTGNASRSFSMDRGRCWYTLRYWGTPAKNLAVLDGQIRNLPTTMTGPTASCAETIVSGNVVYSPADCLPGGGKVSVRDLPEDNLSLLASMGAVAEVAEGKRDGFIWDARGFGEYSGGTMGGGRYMQGHPKGTVQLDWPSMLNDDGTYRSFADLSALFNGDPAQEFQIWDGPWDLSDLTLGEFRPLNASEQYRNGQTVYVYCETTQRAQPTGFAAAAILGLPTRYYDGAMTQWNTMANKTSTKQLDQYGLPGAEVLPADSPWRMDVPARSNFVYNPANDVNAVVIDDPYAANAEGATIADRTYRLGGATGGSGGGVTPPSNPCGGY